MVGLLVRGVYWVKHSRFTDKRCLLDKTWQITDHYYCDGDYFSWSVMNNTEAAGTYNNIEN